MKIKAAVTYEPSGEFVMDELEIDDPRDDEVLVRIVGAGVCHTDLDARDQHLPIPLPSVMGHEGAGVVEKVGSRVTKVAPGDHVVMSWLSCGACPSCQSGMDPYCHNFLGINFSGARADGSTTLKKGGQAIHGNFFNQSAFASHALATERNVVKVPGDVPLENLAPLGCGVMTGVGSVFNSLKVEPGSSIAVFGVGTVGLSAVMAARACGATGIVAVDLNESRLELARELGATHTVNAGSGDTVEAIQALTGGGPNYSLVCVGAPPVLRQAVDVLAMKGVCGLAGVVAPGTEVVLDMDRIMNGRTITGIIEGDAVPDLFIPTLVDLYMQGKLPFDRLITKYPFDDINQAVEDMEKGRVIKPVLVF